MAEATDTLAKDPFGPAKDFAGTAPRKRSQPGPIRLFFQALASLRLTVVLLFLGMMLVFFGSLAQVDGGIWHIVSKYFRAFVVWVPFQVFNSLSSRYTTIPGGFPYPGGFTIGFLLLVNLITAHALRFRFRAGILLIHSGLIVLLLSELVTAQLAVEATMNIDEGNSSNFVYDTREAELAVISAVDSKQDNVVVIPEAMLWSGNRIEHESLPFDIVVDDFFENSHVVTRKTKAGARATFGEGLYDDARFRPVVKGTDPNQEVDVPSAYLSIRKKGSDTRLGTCLVSCFYGILAHSDWDVTPQVLKHDGKEYRFYLRYRRYYKPYRLYLHDFKHDKYDGTEIPKNFSSNVQLIDPSRGEDREVLIWMNHPLRYAGETFFQASFKRDETGTVLTVVKNPGWLMPYISCVMVSLGLVIHFSQSLAKFLKRELLK